MSLWSTFSRSSVVEHLGETLLHSTWQLVVIAMLAAIAFRLLRTASARYAAGCLGLLLMLAAPLVTFWLIQRGPDRAPAPPLAESTSSELPIASAIPLEPAEVAEAPSTPAPASSDPSAPSMPGWLHYLVGLWAIGVLLLAMRPALSLYTLRTLRRRGHRPVPAELRARLDDLVTRCGLRRSVSLVESVRVRVPLVIGWLRPMILLPASAISGLSPRELELVLLHELGHIRRHDAIVNFAQTLIETLCFHHPAVWWLSARVRAERENCCDDFAVRHSDDPVALARALVRLEEARPAHSLALAASGSDLRSRVQRLLGRPAAPSRLPGWIAGGLLALLPVAALALGIFQDPGKETPEAGETILRTEAVALAEEFVRANGYTDSPPSRDLDRIRLESTDHASDVGEILRRRKGNLAARAVGVSRTEHGWLVGFRHPNSDESTGRGVTMDAFGESLRLEQEDLRLSALQTTLISTEKETVSAGPYRWVAVGRVTDRDGHGIADASVRVATGVGTLLGGGETKTGPDGEYRLELTEGIFSTEPDSANRQIAWFFVSSPNHVEWSRTRPELLTMARFREDRPDEDDADQEPDLVVANEPYRLDFVLTEPATLLIDVVDERGAPIDDAGLELDEGHQTSKAKGADDLRDGARYAWSVRPEMDWTLSVPGAENRHRTQSDPIRPPGPGEYRLTLRWNRDGGTDRESLEVVQMLDESGRDRRADALGYDPVAQPPLDEAGQREARAVLERVLEVNRYWLSELPPDIRSYRYTLGDRVVESSEPDDRTPRHVSLLHRLGTRLDSVVFRALDVEGDVITVAYTLTEPLRIELGNGIAVAGTSYRGYTSTHVQTGFLRIDRTRWAPLEQAQGEWRETYSRFRAIDETHIAPLSIEVQGKMRFTWNFAIYEPGLWILTGLSGFEDELRLENVHVNDKPAALIER